VLQSSFDNNGLPSTPADGAAALSVAGCKSVEVVASKFRSNEGYPRGAVNINNVGEVLVRGTHFLGNRARELGGAISVTDVPSTILSRVIFRDNTAARGAALYAASSVVTAQSTAFTRNVATAGGTALLHGCQLQANRVFFVQNVSGANGVVLEGDASSRATLANVVLARNRGGVGPVRVAAGALANTTIVDNDGVGLRALQDVTVANSVIAGNSAGNCEAASPGALRDLGSNVQYPERGCPSGFLIAEPALDEFFAPMPSSPLYRRGNDTVCTTAPVSKKDAYGQPRPRANSCTIGAVEGTIEQIAREYVRRPQ
jgi:predicted outer membrane repeat protein